MTLLAILVGRFDPISSTVDDRFSFGHLLGSHSRPQCLVRFFLANCFLLCIGLLSGCSGGSGGGGGSTPPASTITSVTVTCSLASVLTTQTSTCTATVQGTGSFSSVVSWSISPTSIGTVSSSGVFTPSGTGTAAITAISTQDSTKSGSASVVVTANPIPTVTKLSPSSVTAGASETNVSISGTGFVKNSSATLDATSLSTTFVSSTSLQVAIPASNLAIGQLHLITVTNPAPGGGASATVGPWMPVGTLSVYRAFRANHTQTLLQNDLARAKRIP